ncbi:hypothetical protein PSN13_04067 [Micromonospora saelicesensis]|uniref:Uncharacterized protein n=1 Tax=Micromonospora saelicesensis TaxID=285676 RepID=A0A328NST0_9ACTN|nr:hypothetical protein PSN13_04067 [Micromonospora saelicesensis]
MARQRLDGTRGSCDGRQSTLKRRSQQFVRGVVEGDQANALNPCRRCSDGRDCDLRCLVGRESVHASGDGGEGDAASANLIGNLKAAPIARCQDVSLAVAAAFPDRANGVDDVTYWWVQVKSWRGNRIAGITRSQRCPRLGQARPRRTMNRPVDTTATQQRLVRRGHDGVDVLAGDVATNNFDHRHGSMMPPAGQPHPSSRHTAPLARRVVRWCRAATGAYGAAVSEVRSGLRRGRGTRRRGTPCRRRR